MVRGALPEELEQAVLRALDAEADSARTPGDAEHRIALLRLMRSTVDAWNMGRMSLDEALTSLEALVRAVSEPAA